MKFAIVVYETAADMQSRGNPEQMAAYSGYIRALSEAGVSVGGAGLHPPATATTLRMRGGERQVQDGPFADTKEQLGGFFLIEVPSLDKALEWAARCPAATTGCVEVRPVLPPVNR